MQNAWFTPPRQHCCYAKPHRATKLKSELAIEAIESDGPGRHLREPWHGAMRPVV